MKPVSVQRITMAALLIAIGVAIPMVSPAKIVMPPASFTLASHVAIFIAMTISPGVAAAVTIGTTFGFLLGGFHIAIVLRAASHMLFVMVGAFYIVKQPNLLHKPIQSRVFSVVIAFIHAVGEVAVVMPFYFSGSLSDAYYDQGFVWAVLVLVGVGTVIHSMVDFEIARVLVFALEKQKGYAAMTGKVS